MSLSSDYRECISMSRQLGDQYYTPPTLADALMRRLIADGWVTPDCSVLEPSAGGGAFVTALQRHVSDDVIAIDIDAPDSICCDFLDWTMPADLVCGNPPFRDAERHVRHALGLRNHGGTVAFLLRLAFLEGKCRADFWNANPPSMVYVLRERPSFIRIGEDGTRVNTGTDSCAYGFFVWRADMPHGHRGSGLDFLSWKQ